MSTKLFLEKNMIQYDVIASQPLNHQFTVRLTIPHPSPLGQKLSLPTWIPGSYMIRDFARHIVELKVYADFSARAQEIVVEKQNSHTWQVAKHQGPLCIEYSVYAFDTSVRGSYLDDEQAFFNPCSLLLMVHDQEDKPCQVILSAPAMKGGENWRVATMLTPIDAKPWGYGIYQAANYDELIDKPVQMGQFDLIEFEAIGIPHAIAITGQHYGDVKRLAADVKKVCEAQLQLFEKPYPFNRYLFLLNLRKDSYGGLEHRDSTALQIPKEYMPESVDAAPTSNYIMLLGLFSHEYFHAWNVKRIKPQSFMPYVLTDKAYTKQLWAFEGITSYYDDLA
ncbi:MAG TPA: M61 family peptidase, partial [Candidatus Berkiella sp.]|nr:M61 family peptidase [Candidatus Berkiella sp.]